MLSLPCLPASFFSVPNRSTNSCSIAPSRATTDFAASTSTPISRRLILLRHAHSSWDDLSLRGTLLFSYSLSFPQNSILISVSVSNHAKTIDHDRPLTKTGRADAAKVAQVLSTLGWLPQLILSRSSFQKP